MPYFWYDSTLLWLLPGILLGFVAQMMVQSAYAKYAQIATTGGWTGASLAGALLRQGGRAVSGVAAVPGTMSDHYDPRTDMVNLSAEVYASSSIAALGIAAHEVGHAFQHEEGYLPIQIRSAIVPVVNIGSSLAVPILLVGLFLTSDLLINLGLVAYALTIVFTLVTLPVEFNASRRAMAALQAGGYLTPGELSGARKMLSAAALTYVAAALMSILQFARLLTLSGRRRR